MSALDGKGAAAGDDDQSLVVPSAELEETVACSRRGGRSGIRSGLGGFRQARTLNGTRLRQGLMS